MAGEREFRTDITADPTQFNAAMEAMAQKAMTESQRMQSSMRESFAKIGDAAREGIGQANAHFDNLKAAVEKVRGVFLAVGAVVTGGAMFGKLVEDSAKATDETRKLSLMLGITLEKASALRTALGMIGMGADEYTSAVAKMTMKLRDNEERFNDLGIATRGSNKELLSGEEVMQNSLKALLQYKEGTDRNLASTEIFGKGWAEVVNLMRLTPAVMEAARQKVEELQTTVGPDGAARALQYKLAMNDVKEMFEAIANRVGQAMMPVLTQLAEWFASIGPAAVVVMRGAIGGFAAVFWSLKLTVEIVYGAIKTALELMVINILRVGTVITKALSLDFVGAKAAWQAGGDMMVDTFDAAMGKIVEQAADTDKRIKALFDPSAEQGASPGGGKGGKPYTGKPKDAPADKSRMSQWEAELSAQRDAYDKQKLEQGSFQQYTLAMERDFWKQILDTVAMTDDERASASKKYYAAELQLRKQAFDAEIADIKAKIAQHKQGSLDRIQLAGEAAAKIGEKYGLESKEYKQALGEMSKMAEERYKQQQKLEEMALERTKESKVAAIELERQALDDAEKLGLIHADQKLARLKQLKELEYQIELQAENDQAAIYDLDEVAYQQHLDKIAKLKEKHAADMVKLDGQIAAESKKSLDTLLDPIGNAFQKLMDGMIQGTQTWRQAINKSLLAIGADYLAAGTKWVMEHIKIEIMKTQATTAGVAARSAAEQAGSAQSILLTAWTAIKNITAAAWEAAAAAFKAIVGIPVIGPALAPEVAAGAAATVLGFAGNFSAAGGFDVPRGLSPVTRLHPEEMVLPDHLANAVRAMAGNGAGAGGGGGGVNVNINAAYVDAAGIRRLFMDNGSALSDSIRRQARNFTPLTPK